MKITEYTPSITKYGKTKKASIKRVEIKANELSKFYAEVEASTGSHSMPSWVGATESEMRDLTKYGDLSQVKASKEFAKEVDRKIPLPTKKALRVRSVCGGSVNIAAALAGNPIAFRRNIVKENPRNPVRIYVDIGCSAGVSQEAVETRGRAIIALASLLSQTRPVEVIAFSYLQVSGKKEALTTINLGMTPINWAKAGAVLCHTALFRDLCFRTGAMLYGKRYSANHWGRHYNGDVIANEILQARDEDIIMGRSYLKSRVTKDPIGWVKDELERIISGELHGDRNAKNSHRASVQER